MDLLSDFVNALLIFLGQAAPWVVVGFVIAAVVHEFVPVAVMARHFGGRGVLPVAKASSAGLLLPICSCSTIPLGVGMFRNGAARGTSLSFMTSAPTVSPVSVLMAVAMLGAVFAVSHLAAAVIASVAIGLVANRLLTRTDAAQRMAIGETHAAGAANGDAAGNAAGDAAADPEPAPPLRQRMARAWRWLIFDFGGTVSVQLAIGLTAAALLQAVIPPEWVQGALGRPSVWTLLVVMAVAIPAYHCSLAAIPMVAGLMAMGMSPGAAVTFLIGGPATNLGEINAIRGQMGGRAALLYVVGLTVAAVGAGLVVDRVIFPDGFELPAAVAATGDHGHAHHGHAHAHGMTGAGDAADGPALLAELVVPVWHWPFVGALVLMMGASLTHRVRRRLAARHGVTTGSCCSPASTGPSAAQPAAQPAGSCCGPAPATPTPSPPAPAPAASSCCGSGPASAPVAVATATDAGNEPAGAASSAGGCCSGT